MRNKFFDHLVLILGVLFLMLPAWLALTSSTHSAEYLARNGMQFWFGDEFISTYKDLLFGSSSIFINDTSVQLKGASGLTMLQNSLIMGLGFAVGKIIISMLAAYAIVYFRFPLGTFLFWIIFSYPGFNARGIEDSHSCQMRVKFLADRFGHINHVIKHRL